MQPDEIMDLVCSDAPLTGNALLEVGRDYYLDGREGRAYEEPPKCLAISPHIQDIVGRFCYVCWERGQGSQDLRKPEEN